MVVPSLQYCVIILTLLPSILGIANLLLKIIHCMMQYGSHLVTGFLLCEDAAIGALSSVASSFLENGMVFGISFLKNYSFSSSDIVLRMKILGVFF